MKGSLARIAELVRRETGITVPQAREGALRAAVHRASAGQDPGLFLRATADVADRRELVGRLIDEVTVRETSFVRDRGQLDAIDWYHLLKAAQAAGPGTIRMWSAGCASGEEAYTLALLAAEAFAPAPPPVDVLGTDISGAALTAAAAGHYQERAVRGLSTAQRLRYLKRSGDGGFVVGDQLRSLVRFRRHNLARDPIPPPGETGFDFIACRNVLIYFDRQLAGRVIESLEGALRRDGVLLLGAADVLQRTASRRPPRTGSPAGHAAVGHAAVGHASAGRALAGRTPVDRAPGAAPGARPPAPRKPRAGEPRAGEPRAGEPRADQSAMGPSGAGASGAGCSGARAPATPATDDGCDPRPPGGDPSRSRERRLAAALQAADGADRDGALAQVAALLAADPLDADAHFINGLVILEAGEPARAAAALRRALFIDGAFALAAFTLGRAYDALGDPPAARQAYARALRTLDPDDHRHEQMLQQVDIGDIAAACRARLEARR